jgi:hypothetical protein
MSRQKLFTLLASLSLLAAAACTDMTAPRDNGPKAPCPISGGSDTCVQ